MLVLDSSAILDSLVADPPKRALMERLLLDGDFHAPHLVDVELLSALRRLVAKGELAVTGAEQARAAIARLAITRYAHGALLDRVWRLRHNLTAYDATFVALSETLQVPLITTDTGLAGASGHAADVELY